MLFSRTKSFKSIPNRSEIAMSVSPLRTVYFSRNSSTADVVVLNIDEGELSTGRAGFFCAAHAIVPTVSRATHPIRDRMDVSVIQKYRLTQEG